MADLPSPEPELTTDPRLRPILEELQAREPIFHRPELGTTPSDTYALTYTLRQGKRTTRRLTLWRKVQGVWKILFHQGTLVAE